jgi:carbamate kinase
MTISLRIVSRSAPRIISPHATTSSVSKKGLTVVALGGNALLRRGEPAESDVQRHNVRVAVRAIAELTREHEVVVTHGNGPQVGLLALQGEAYGQVTPYPLDILGAESEGMIGYLIEQELVNDLGGSPVATLLTQVIVDADDRAFREPTKPIGPLYDRAAAERLAAERGWSIAPDGEGYRRVVASPEPRSIVELSTIRLLVDASVLVVCAGGGGIPVIVDGEDRLRGVEAVVDKDLAAALLACGLGADTLLMLTDVPAVQAGWGTPEARALDEVTPEQLRAMSSAPGSMGPKVDAACRFVEATGGIAAIGSLEDACAILEGKRGTRVRTPG